jgi:hypothetical protein
MCVLRKNPQQKYFQYDGNGSDDTYRSSADMLAEGITLLNEYFFEVQKKEQIDVLKLEDVLVKVVYRWGGFFGFLATMEHFVPDDKRARLLQLRNEKFKRDYEQEKRDYGP